MLGSRWTRRPGGEHDTTAARTHPETLPALRAAADDLRAIGERGNSLLKTTFKALRNVSLNPWRIGEIVAAALALLHFDHARTT